MTDILTNIQIGLGFALSPWNLMFCFIGVFLGTLLGALPGIGVLSALAMLYPVTFYLDPGAALIMLSGIYYGTAYGGSTASILLNLPGTPANTVACFDGYPMAKQGRAGVALFITTIGSFVGGSMGILALMLFAPIIVQFAFTFGPAEYFSLMVFGLLAASSVAIGSQLKGITMTVVGILLGIVGTDIYTGTQRLTFRSLDLADGVGLVALAMGLFGVAELVSSISSNRDVKVHQKITLRSMIPTAEDMRRSWMPMLRGSAIGSVLGALPGVGSTISSFMSYAVEKRISKNPSEFGHGAVEGVAGPEAANNANDQTSFVPTLTLGIPGSAGMALMLSILIVHGITPGPGLMNNHPDLFWGLIMSFWIGNLLLVILNIPLIGIFVRILTIPYYMLYPAVLMFVCIGVYIVRNSVFDVVSVAAFGLLGYFLRIARYPAPMLLLGFVLGPLMEEYFRRAMIISRGNFEIFVARPVSATFLLLSVLIVAWGISRSVRGSKLLPA